MCFAQMDLKHCFPKFFQDTGKLDYRNPGGEALFLTDKICQ